MFKKLFSILTFYKKSIIFVLFFIAIIFSIYLLFLNLGSFPLENWDEAFYGQTTKEIIQTKDVIALHWNYNIWLEKPPMFIWITTLTSLVFGLSEFSMRLPSAISALIIIFTATIYSYKKFSLIPAFFTFFTLILNNVFMWRSRSGNIDLFASLLILATYFILLSKNKFKYLLLGFLFFCIYLTKASLVLFPLVIFILNEFFYERKLLRQNLRKYCALLIIFIGLSSVWLFFGYLQNGSNFVINYTLHADQGVAKLSHFNLVYIQHLYYSLQRRFFWIFLFGLIFTLWNIRKREYFLLFMYANLLLFQLSFSDRDNNWYLIPSMPFWSIIIGFGVYSGLKLLKKTKILCLTASVGIVIISSYIFYKTYSVNILPILFSSSTIEQAQSARMLSKLSKPSDVIVRLDPLIPTTLYYDNRKTLAYSPDTSSHYYWIGSQDLAKSINSKNIKWLVGTNIDVDKFFESFDAAKFQKIQVNNKEVILKVN